jgi:hypothetical protein
MTPPMAKRAITMRRRPTGANQNRGAMTLWCSHWRPGLSINEAAERAGCSPRTVSRRLAEREFARRVSIVRGQLFAVAVGRLCNHAALAADKLVALLDSEQDHVAYAAAKSILELGTKLREAGELEERLAALEGIAQGNDRGNEQAPAA